jgi:hypothetical protein
MGKKHAIAGLIGVILIVVAIATWWGFRWTITDNPALGVIREYRWFGRITRITVDSNRDGGIDAEMNFAWSQPYEGEQFGGVTPYRRIREDRNFDGRWDTWIEPVDESMKSTRVSADTTGDGEADWIRTCGTFESAQLLQELKANRGF